MTALGRSLGEKEGREGDNENRLLDPETGLQVPRTPPPPPSSLLLLLLLLLLLFLFFLFFFFFLLSDFPFPKALSFLYLSLWNFSHILTTTFCTRPPWRNFDLGPNQLAVRLHIENNLVVCTWGSNMTHTISIFSFSFKGVKKLKVLTILAKGLRNSTHLIVSGRYACKAVSGINLQLMQHYKRPKYAQFLRCSRLGSVNYSR